MSERRQDLIVGLFVLVGLTTLGIMIVAFGEAPSWFGAKRYPIRISFTDKLSDVQEGTPIMLGGIQIGRVRSLAFQDADHPEQGTYVFAMIEFPYVIPAGSIARVRPAAIGFGRSDISIEVSGVTKETVPIDGTAVIRGQMGSPLDSIFPQSVILTLEKTASQIGALAEELTPVAGDLHQILQLRPISEVEQAKARGQELSPNLYTTVDRLYLVLTHFDEVIGDPATQSNVKLAIENFLAFSEEAKAAAKDLRAFAKRAPEIGTKIESTLDNTNDQIGDLGRKLAHNSDQLADVLDYLTKASRELAEGDGTMAKFLRDPKLYDDMVYTIGRLREAIGDLQKLIDKLDEKGLFYKG